MDLFRSFLLFLSAFMAFADRSLLRADELQPLAYHSEGLTVDLGVGLWAWPIPCDADNDGDYDLIVSCPDKPSNGVWYFENGGMTRNGLPVFKPSRRLSPTVHYVMPSYVEGKLRVLSPGFEYSSFTTKGLTDKQTLPIPANFHKPVGTQPKGPKVRHNQWRYADYDGDGALDLVVGIEDWSDYGWDDAWDTNGRWINGPLHGWVYVFRNSGTSDAPQYEDPARLKTGDVLLETYGCPSPNFEDFDGDGDLDLLCGEFLNGFTYFENTGSRTKPSYALGQRLKNDQGQPLAMDLQMIVPVAFDWDKDGDADLIVGDEDGRVAFVENVSSPAPGKAPVFRSPVYFQQVAETLKCGALATPCGTDWDGDGDQDIVSGNTAGYIEIFENESGPGVESPRWAAPKKLMLGDQPFRIQAGPNGSIQGPAEAQWGYTTLNVADWDVDGLPDVVFNSILGRVSWMKNVGTRALPRFEEVRPVDVDWKQPQPNLAWGWLRPDGAGLLTQWRTTPVIHDFNQDGLSDLAMLDHEGYLAFFERHREDGQLRLKAPRRAFVDESGQPLRLTAGVAGKSGRRKLCVTDWDGDGKFDFLLNSANADLLKQVEARDGAWVMKPAGSLAKRNIEGHDVSPTTVDFDGNGVPDFLGGAEDGRMYYLRNPRGSL
ncbi:MAG: VCBS repeat-containing protein [Planctomycetaceae bacterium]